MKPLTFTLDELKEVGADNYLYVGNAYNCFWVYIQWWREDEIRIGFIGTILHYPLREKDPTSDVLVVIDTGDKFMFEKSEINQNGHFEIEVVKEYDPDEYNEKTCGFRYYCILKFVKD